MPPATTPPSGPAAEAVAYGFDGRVDFLGYHGAAGGWFLAGWIAHPWPLGHRPGNAVLVFDDESTTDLTHSHYFHREDVAGRGIGFVYYMRSSAPRGRVFQALKIVFDSQAHAIPATETAQLLEGSRLADSLGGPLNGGPDASQRSKMQRLLRGEREPGRAKGLVDFYGYHAAMGGWLVCGWIDFGWQERGTPQRIVLSFQEGDVGGDAVGLLFPRPDLADGAEGVVLFVRTPAAALGNLYTASLEAGATRATLYRTAVATRVRESELQSRLRPVLGQAAAGDDRDSLIGMLARQPYADEDTLTSLDADVFIGLDEAVQCGDEGLVLMGWFLAKPGSIREMRVRSATSATVFEPQGGILVERPDVIQEFTERGFEDLRCGFIVFLAHAVKPESRLYIEVETMSGAVGYQRIPPLRLGGLAAMKRLLAPVDVRFADIQAAYDKVLGPAMEALNRRRLARRPALEVIDYGQVPAQPRFSVIVPLYGRLDYIEYQLALFSAHPRFAEVEFIYVLDDPDRRREAQYLFASAYQRFLVPFRAVLLDENVGFAPASNIGLAHAHGTTVTFLNSDVFPGTLDWLERLADRLDADPSIGVIGPVLLYEDDSVQHRGMYFERLPEFGNWFFAQHHGKAMRHPGEGGGVERHISITGACMMMARTLAEKLGGFDETYAVGDFEDSDLCFKVQALGLSCAVDPDTQLFHLERKSQVGSEHSWRMNLTLYNAWQHERRWGATIAAQQGV